MHVFLILCLTFILHEENLHFFYLSPSSPSLEETNQTIRETLAKLLKSNWDVTTIRLGNLQYVKQKSKKPIRWPSASTSRHNHQFHLQESGQWCSKLRSNQSVQTQLLETVKLRSHRDPAQDTGSNNKSDKGYDQTAEDAVGSCSKPQLRRLKDVTVSKIQQQLNQSGTSDSIQKTAQQHSPWFSERKNTNRPTPTASRK